MTAGGMERYQQRQTDISTLFQRLNLAEIGPADLADKVAQMTDAQLLELGKSGTDLEKVAFLLRGAAGYTLRERIRTRLQGSKLAQQKEIQIGIELMKVAQEMGCGYDTLRRDIQIYDTYFAGCAQAALAEFSTDTATVQEPGPMFGAKHAATLSPMLEREYYHVALSAPDPQQALDLAETKKANDPTYSSRQFKRDVEELKARSVAPPSDNNPPPPLEDVYHLSLQISQQSRESLMAAARQAQMAPAALVEQLIRQAASGDAQRTVTFSAPVWEMVEALGREYEKRHKDIAGGYDPVSVIYYLLIRTGINSRDGGWDVPVVLQSGPPKDAK